MNTSDILDVLYETMNQCESCCMDDTTDRRTFADTFAYCLRRKQQELDGAKKRPLRKSVMVRKKAEKK